MNSPVRAVAHLVVLGVALVVAGVRPAGPAPVAPATAPVASYRPPAVVAEPATLHRSAPHRPSHVRHHRTGRLVHRASGRQAAPATRPVGVNHVRLHHTAAHLAALVTGPTDWSALNAAIARIPTYRAGSARWVVSRAFSQWGTADWYHDTLYISPTVPTGYLYDVAVHEWSHELSVLDYDGDVAAAVQAMNAWFGGSGLVGSERAADCMAILQGATWTHYTTCDNATWRAGAAKLVGGHRL